MRLPECKKKSEDIHLPISHLIYVLARMLTKLNPQFKALDLLGEGKNRGKNSEKQ
jgi:hypothetical protein